MRRPAKTARLNGKWRHRANEPLDDINKQLPEFTPDAANKRSRSMQ